MWFVSKALIASTASAVQALRAVLAPPVVPVLWTAQVLQAALVSQFVQAWPIAWAWQAAPMLRAAQAWLVVQAQRVGQASSVGFAFARIRSPRQTGRYREER